MPQFDQFSFHHQVTTFIFFFVFLYFALTYFVLPTIISIIKFRKKKEQKLTYFFKSFLIEKMNNATTNVYFKIFLNLTNSLTSIKLKSTQI